MDIQSLLSPLSAQAATDNNAIVINTLVYSKSTQHERETSWSSFSDSPTSPSSTFSYCSTPSSPELSTPDTPMSPNQFTEGLAEAPARPSRGQLQTRTPWSAEEDELLQQGYMQDLSWARISTVYLPHRSRGCCWGRFKTLQAKALEQREWSESEDKLLQTAVKKHSRLFKQAWKAVSQEMSNRTWKECELRSTRVSTGTIQKKSKP
jgi:hypothetical protein